jgi:hypothetical protein
MSGDTAGWKACATVSERKKTTSLLTEVAVQI